MTDKAKRGRVRRLAWSVATLLMIALASCGQPSSTPVEREVLLGGLFSLTGPGSTLGMTGQAAMEIAVEDVNRYLAGNAAGIRFATAIEDTRMEPALALEKTRALHARGVQLLIGAQSSAEVEHVKPYVDANHLLLVSPSSTAGTLALSGDNIFRFTPPDTLEAVANTAMMWDEGIRTLIPVWIDDAGGNGLEQATRRRFTALGGTVLPGVRYTAAADFKRTVADVNAQLEQALAQQGPKQVAVYLAGFDEVVQIFAEASAKPVLASVRWYGSDGVALSDALLRDPRAVNFAIRTGYPNPSFGFEQGAREIWEPLVQRIEERCDHQPNAFALAVYDAVWAVARGYVASGATTDIEKLKHVFTTAAATGYGATGWTVLDDAGDRKYGDFDFWAVRLNNGEPRWARVAQYESRTGRLVR